MVAGLLIHILLSQWSSAGRSLVGTSAMWEAPETLFISNPFPLDISTWHTRSAWVRSGRPPEAKRGTRITFRFVIKHTDTSSGKFCPGNLHQTARFPNSQLPKNWKTTV